MDDSGDSLPYANQNTENSDSNNEMSSQGNKEDKASSPHMDQDTETSDSSSEMSSQENKSFYWCPAMDPHYESSDNSIEMSSQDSDESYGEDDEMLSYGSQTDTDSQGSKTETASPDSEEFLNGKINVPSGFCSSKATGKYSSEELPAIFRCDVCFKSFPDREQFLGHRIESPPITYTCEECHSRFYIECNFEYHKSFEHTPNLFSPEKEE